MANQQTAAGGMTAPKLPNFLVLDSSSLNNKEERDELRDYIKQSRIEYVFPEGLASVPVVAECRVLCDLDNFDNMYDLTMQYLEHKPIIINLVNNDGSKTVLGNMRVQDKFTDLREMDCVADYPWLVNWLCEFMAGHLSKKFPLPAQSAVSPAAEQRKGTARQTPKRTS